MPLHPGQCRAGNYEKHASRVSQVIAAVAKVSCKHGLWLVARVNKTGTALPHFCDKTAPVKGLQSSFPTGKITLLFLLYNRRRSIQVVCSTYPECSLSACMAVYRNKSEQVRCPDRSGYPQPHGMLSYDLPVRK